MNLQKTVDDMMNLADAVHEGNMKASKAYSLLYQLEQAVKSVKKEIETSVLDELDKYGKNDLPVHDGFRVTQMSRSIWKYNDSILDNLSQQVKARQKAMQQAYAHYSKHGEDFVTADGEIIPLAEKSTTTYIKMEKV